MPLARFPGFGENARHTGASAGAVAENFSPGKTEHYGLYCDWRSTWLVGVAGYLSSPASLGILNQCAHIS